MKKINLTAVISMLMLACILASCNNRNTEKDVPENSIEQSAPEADDARRRDTLLAPEEGPRGVAADSTQASPPVISRP